MSRIWLALVTGLAFILFSVPAMADGGVDDLVRLIGKPKDQISAEALHLQDEDTLRLTSNKDEIIRLEQDASSVIVNNPEHAEVVLDSPRLLVVMPRLPGTTSFTVLNSRGETILHKNIIVTNVGPKYVRVRRACSVNDGSCVPIAYYYCPDGCYEVTPVAPGRGNTPPPPAATSASTAASMGPNGQSPDTAPIGADGEPAPPNEVTQ